MKLSLAGGSLLCFGLSVVLWVALTVFEAALVGISLMAERVITFLGLVLPAGAGVALGLASLLRKNGNTGLAIAGVTLNSLFALFHLMILAFAG